MEPESIRRYLSIHLGYAGLKNGGVKRYAEITEAFLLEPKPNTAEIWGNGTPKQNKLLIRVSARRCAAI